MNGDHSKGTKRRSGLLTVATLGGLVCLLGGTVLFSALQDTARTGTNSAESAALAASADIQLATATYDSAITCGAFSENLASGLFTVTGVIPEYQSGPVYFCIRNVGSQEVTLSALTEDLVDLDVACTGDEVDHGDTTCGGDQTGELSSVLIGEFSHVDCASGAPSPGLSNTLDQSQTMPLALGSLAAATTRCFRADLGYSGNAETPGAQKAQSDRVTWRFKFTAQA
jgi:hypothetical protein